VKLLILDEPTNGLDIPSKAQFRKVISKYFTDERSIIVSTHQVKDVENLIDEVIILENGAVVFHNSVDEVSRKLTKTKSIKDGETVLFTDHLPDGEVYLVPSDKGESQIDLEMLFNAVITNPEKIQEVFNSSK
jgi:ABC-2 type transport system ATP-binding protein